MSMSTLTASTTPSLLGMPNEILSEIIRLVPAVSGLPVEKALLRLGAVCRDINMLIKETPSLWSTIQVGWTTPNYRIPLTDTNVFLTTKLALVHSRTKLLDIEFTVPPDSDKEAVELFSVDHCEALMSLLLTHSSRIRSFHLKGTCWTHHVAVAIMLKQCHALPNLRRWEQECVRSDSLPREVSFLMAGYTHWNHKAPFLTVSDDETAYVPPSLEVVSISASSYSWSKFSCQLNVTQHRRRELANFTTKRLRLEERDMVMRGERGGRAGREVVARGERWSRGEREMVVRGERDGCMRRERWLHAERDMTWVVGER
ncbi:hypothetical protein BDZ89DRAFT_1111419 [Hymenopellis radicata]|nr:hypothetical protein BDZ89DRAFT_1111419 [Hymenopellis radicata]